MTTAPLRRAVARAAAAVLAVTLVPATLVAGAPPAHAAAAVTVSGVDGRAQAAADGPTTVRVTGSDFQSVAGGFGGIYVVFGWVEDPASGSWRPSQGGRTGAEYRYVPDSESADNQGYQRFVAFPGSDTAASANGGVIAADGSWATDLVVPGPRFSAQDRTGAVTEVDCTRVQCGVLTIGAHGVASAANETFTPVSFGAAPAVGGAPAAGTAAPQAAPADAVAGRAPATLGVDAATAVVGRAMTFAAQGFEPGEQVVATLDDGVVSLGPLTTGVHGEVAGVLQLPADLRAGTHVLRLSGATSALAPQVEVTVTRDPAEANAADLLAASATEAGTGVLAGYTWPELAVAGAGLVLLATVAASAVTARRRRRTAAPPPPDASPVTRTVPAPQPEAAAR